MDEVLPVANELDPRHEDIPAALLDRMGELGLFGVLIPEDEGGLGLGVCEYCLVSEELARAWMSVGSIIARGNGTGCDSADPDRRLELRRASAAGRRIGAIAFSEPEAGSDLANVASARPSATATRGWSPAPSAGSGTRCPPTSSTCSPAPARRARTAAPPTASSCSWSRRSAAPSPTGVTGTPIDKIGYFGLTTWELELDGLRLPADALQDTGEEEGQGFKHSLGWLNVARAQTAARAVGLARGALEDALTYCQQRVQFGEPIGNQQVIRHMLADMSADVAAARQLYQHAAWLVDSGAPANTETSQAKLFASEMAERVTSQALQIFGGNGYTTRVLRRALLARRPADQDLRGHVGDPAPDHRRQPARAARRSTGDGAHDASTRPPRSTTCDAVRRSGSRTLTGDYAGIVEASQDSNADDEHDPEGSTIAFERSQVGALVEDARHQLAEVDAAWARLADGTYGTCEACGEPDRRRPGWRRDRPPGPASGARPAAPEPGPGGQSRVSLRCVTRCGRAASTPSRSTLLAS